jgi:hypothetical protein
MVAGSIKGKRSVDEDVSSVVEVNEIDWRQEICEIWDMTGRSIDE